MSMDRQQLARAIDVGRSSTLNCFETTKDIAGIAAAIADDDPLGPMFRNKYLNDSIVFKIVDSIVIKGKRRYGVETLIYFPYNHQNIYEGGDSILVSDHARAEKLLHKCGLDPAKDDGSENSVWDNDMMDMIGELPTLDPFLLKCKAQQLGIENKLNPAYYNITLEEWNRIQKPIRAKIDALVRKALGMEKGDVGVDPELNIKIEQNISKFLKKIWEARDIEGIEDFVYGMEMPPERAPELFFAWKAICYYQVQFSEVEHSMRRLFAWIGNAKTALPLDYRGLRQETQDQIQRELKLLRSLFRENYASIVSTLKNYEESYRQFIEDSKPAPFKEFLSNADTYYVDLAACLSGNSHAINLLEDQIRRTGAQIYSDQHRLLINCMLGVFGVDSESPEVMTAN
jgi:hypothetical protein